MSITLIGLTVTKIMMSELAKTLLDGWSDPK